MMRSLKKNLILLLIPLLWLLLTTFSSRINNLVIRLVPPTVRSEEEERVVENGSLQAYGPTIRQEDFAFIDPLRGGPYADR
jgi:hypothetical protein